MTHLSLCSDSLFPFSVGTCCISQWFSLLWCICAFVHLHIPIKHGLGVRLLAFHEAKAYRGRRDRSLVSIYYTLRHRLAVRRQTEGRGICRRGGLLAPADSLSGGPRSIKPGSLGESSGAYATIQRGPTMSVGHSQDRRAVLVPRTSKRKDLSVLREPSRNGY
ncbi:uncharacterized protein BP01DRAFT_24693 [Aspergillus saccharolyticus JOP 1030-1]|uniref:Uncharacterized protein n=1 Tax=Aspergillus saccharolyticus JOP 1030-1 TaxID=1450539 RepID=A0A319A1K9_9EURO|nr:hypothetical protein BP01DRAFT_24693 [Aspergillus saccharolyticus JOP 1030-1]PYH46168.1 hypothetical protein BP01DRAFT_24693 [Aspergillus saccharolyticus JOP 1030-1]